MDPGDDWFYVINNALLKIYEFLKLFDARLGKSERERRDLAASRHPEETQ